MDATLLLPFLPSVRRFELYGTPGVIVRVLDAIVYENCEFLSISSVTGQMLDYLTFSGPIKAFLARNRNSLIEFSLTVPCNNGPFLDMDFANCLARCSRLQKLQLPVALNSSPEADVDGAWDFPPSLREFHVFLTFLPERYDFSGACALGLAYCPTRCALTLLRDKLLDHLAQPRRVTDQLTVSGTRLRKQLSISPTSTLNVATNAADWCASLGIRGGYLFRSIDLAPWRPHCHG